MTWALDLDGVVWLAGKAVPGSPEAVARLRAAGERVIFLTNNAGPLVSGHLEALARIGIDCAEADLATSAQAAASLVEPGQRASVVGDEGTREALTSRGVQVVPATEEPDVVVVARTVDLDYSMLSAAAAAVRQGARFIATNTDTTFPTGSASSPEAGRDGLLPGAGALVAFVAAAAGRQPEVAGKPHQAMARLVARRYGTVDFVVGDRPSTDGLFAKLVGSRFGLVFTGVTTPDDMPVDPAPDLSAPDLGALVDSYLAGH